MAEKQEVAQTVSISQVEYDRLQETIRRQRDEIQGLECRIKKLLEP